MFGAIKEIYVYQCGDYRSVEFERVVGTKPVQMYNQIILEPRYRLNKYQASEASMKRLHKAVSSAVNKGEATISLYEHGYYAEF